MISCVGLVGPPSNIIVIATSRGNFAMPRSIIQVARHLRYLHKPDLVPCSEAAVSTHIRYYLRRDVLPAGIRPQRHSLRPGAAARDEVYVERARKDG